MLCFLSSVSSSTSSTEAVLSAIAGLKECMRSRNLVRGKQIHSQAIEQGLLSNLYVVNTVITMYSKCGSALEAQKLFDKLLQRDVVSWNCLIRAYAENGDPLTALQKFDAMEAQVSPDARSYLLALSACSALGVEQRKRNRVKNERTNWLEKGKAIHQRALINRCCNIYVESMLVSMYSKCGSMALARKAFDSMNHPDVVAWNALLYGYVENGESRLALELFEAGQDRVCSPNDRTYIAALKACSSLASERRELIPESLEKGRSIHSRALKSSSCTIFVESALVEMYSKCGCMDEARGVFEKMSRRDVISWNCLIQGYVENQENELALELVASMKSSSIRPSSTTFIFALVACANLMALESGRRYHAEIWRSGLEKELATCLVDFYGKCGSLEEAKRVFDSIRIKNLDAWNALMYGHSQQGDSRRVLELFEEMKHRGVSPDKISFTHILNACSHAGLRSECRKHFSEMSSRYGVKPDLIHYTCLVDSSARGNRLLEALEMVRSMPFEPDDVVWTAILGACWKWKNVEIGSIAYEELIKLQGRGVDVSGAYVLMSNILGLRGKSSASREPSTTCWTDDLGFVHKFKQENIIK